MEAQSINRHCVNTVDYSNVCCPQHTQGDRPGSHRPIENRGGTDGSGAIIGYG